MRTQVNIKKRPPVELRPDLLLPAAALAIALLAGLLLYGLPLGQALCWALAFGALLPLRFSSTVQGSRSPFSKKGAENALAFSWWSV